MTSFCQPRLEVKGRALQKWNAGSVKGVATARGWSPWPSGPWSLPVLHLRQEGCVCARMHTLSANAYFTKKIEERT